MEMPSGWKRLNNVTATHAPVAVNANDVHTAADLMKEMAEALKTARSLMGTEDVYIEILIRECDFVDKVLNKFKEWK